MDVDWNFLYFIFTAPHHAYHFEANSANAASEAKRSRLMAEQQQKQLSHYVNKQLTQQYNHQQLFQAQMQAAAALRHYQQSFGYRSQPTGHYPVTSSTTSSVTRPDVRISSFQQITPPESLAFWQQQQLTSSGCRSACCNGAPRPTVAYTIENCTPARPAVCCYPMPPTPMVTANPPSGGFCIGCAQGKCQMNVNKENLGIMRSL